MSSPFVAPTTIILSVAHCGTNFTFSRKSLLTVSPSELSALHEYLPPEDLVTLWSTKLWFDLIIFVLLFVLSSRPWRSINASRRNVMKCVRENIFFKHSHYGATLAFWTLDSHRFYTRSKRRRPPWCSLGKASIRAVDWWQVDLFECKKKKRQIDSHGTVSRLRSWRRDGDRLIDSLNLKPWVFIEAWSSEHSLCVRQKQLTHSSRQLSLQRIKELTKNAHIPIILDEHSRNARILGMTRQRFSVVLNWWHEIQYRCGLIVFAVITYALEWLLAFQPRYYRVGSRARSLTMNFVLSIGNKC